MWALSAGAQSIADGDGVQPRQTEGTETYGGKDAFDKAVDALGTNEDLSEVAGSAKNHRYKDKHYVSKDIDGRRVYRALGGAEIDATLDDAFNSYNESNGGGWSQVGGSCGKGTVCTVYRGGTSSRMGYGLLSRTVPGRPTNFTTNSVESVIAVMAHEYVHYQTGLGHGSQPMRMPEAPFGRAEQAAVDLYRRGAR